MSEHIDKLLTAAEVAQRLNCSLSFAYFLMNSGRLKHFVLGKGQGGKRCSEAQLEEFLKAQERGGDPSPPVVQGPSPAITLKNLTL